MSASGRNQLGSSSVPTLMPTKSGRAETSQKQHAAAFRAKRPGHLIAAVRGLDIKLRLALGDPEARGRDPHRCRVGAAALALTIAAMTEQRKDRFSRALVPDGAAQAASRHWASHHVPPCSRLVEPECVLAHYVVYAEIIVWVMPLHIVVPDVVDFFPGDREHRRVLFHDGFGLPHQCQAFGGVDLVVDLVD